MKDPVPNIRTKIRSNNWAHIGSETHRHVCFLKPDSGILPVLGLLFAIRLRDLVHRNELEVILTRQCLYCMLHNVLRYAGSYI
jgi:hypothetical protein